MFQDIINTNTLNEPCGQVNVHLVLHLVFIREQVKIPEILHKLSARLQDATRYNNLRVTCKHKEENKTEDKTILPSGPRDHRYISQLILQNNHKIHYSLSANKHDWVNPPHFCF